MAFVDSLALGDRTVRQALGEAITYTPGVGAAVSVQGIFDAAYTRVDLGQPGVSSVGPAVYLALADLPSDPTTDSGARITRAGVGYTPHEVKPDGLGGVLILLHRS